MRWIEYRGNVVRPHNASSFGIAIVHHVVNMTWSSILAQKSHLLRIPGEYRTLHLILAIALSSGLATSYHAIQLAPLHRSPE